MIGGRPLRRLAALVVACLSLAALASTPGEIDALLNAPLGSADPAKPVQVIAAGTWVFAERASADTQARIDPRQKLKLGKPVELGTFKVDGSKGPVALVVDYGATRHGMTGGQGTVGISLECMERPRECAVPLPKTMLIFSGDRMGKVVLGGGSDTLPLLMGRGAHRYTLPDGETVRVQLEVMAARDFDPMLLKAWLIYGENAVDVVPGQTSRGTMLKVIGGAGALLLAFLLWRLMRRR